MDFIISLFWNTTLDECTLTTAVFHLCACRRVSGFTTNEFTFSGTRTLFPFRTILVASYNFTVLSFVVIVLHRGFNYLCLQILRIFCVQWNDIELNYFWISVNSSWGFPNSHFVLLPRSLYPWTYLLMLVIDCSIIVTTGETYELFRAIHGFTFVWSRLKLTSHVDE